LIADACRCLSHADYGCHLLNLKSTCTSTWFIDSFREMPPKAIILGGGAAAVPIPHVVSSEATFALDASSPPPSSILSLDKRQLPCSSPSPKKVLAVGFDSPKRYIMKVTNISIAEWMERCPEQSVAGATGTGSTYAVVLCEMPTQHVTTKRDMKQVPKKNILIGDDSGKTAELVVWGAFACRAWM